jgi:D-sedoheptulose 7-phosphate isomerase
VRSSSRHATNPLEVVIRRIYTALKTGGKALIFRNGGSAADPQHIVAESVGRLLRERDRVPAIALT